MSPPPPVTPLPGGPPYEAVDIVTFNYDKNMAYAPAAKTYDVRFLSLPFPFLSVLICILTCFGGFFRRPSIRC